MHARDHVQLAGILSYMGPELIHNQQLIVPDEKLFWTASRARIQSWNNQFCSPQTWDSIRPILEEILVSEVLTRVWCGLTLAYDNAHQTDEFGTLAQSIFLSHQDSRNRTMRMMVAGNMVSAHDAVKLNRIRRRAERWSDMMLASFLPNRKLMHLAFDINRAEDFAQDLQFSRPDEQRLQMWKIILTGVSTSFTADLDYRSANHRLNRQISDGILACVPKQEQLDCPFAFLLVDDDPIDEQSGWYERMDSTTTDAQDLVDHLLASDD